ncbi:pantetheine-phosphate adenylyltransferase [Swingsia samuiensis]|uniref:Phosphopantetheine adenylyltransferase n=1 Tax=Swingsia samuiensis TaxID=1293412 RepID=A0A4Y6UHC4_9PROT|nr:pantetheine-phosphate adenylyltransferase [Swingsia samuiensis]QDH16989.1 pantetheine-phosphate adenylyltransferase [Swingsia samuiensis]
MNSPTPKNNLNHRVGFYPGTFDPVTFGHLDIINRASALFEQLYIGIAVNEGKNPLLTLDERLTLMRQEIKHLRYADRIKVMGFEALLVDAVRKVGAGTVVRGIRSAGDFDFESQISGVLRRMAPEIETIFLLSSDGHHATSSRIVKEIARLGGDISPFASKDVTNFVLSKLPQRTT